MTAVLWYVFCLTEAVRIQYRQLATPNIFISPRPKPYFNFEIKNRPTDLRNIIIHAVPCVLVGIRGCPASWLPKPKVAKLLLKAAVALGFCGHPGVSVGFGGQISCKSQGNLTLGPLGFCGYPGLSVLFAVKRKVTRKSRLQERKTVVRADPWQWPRTSSTVSKQTSLAIC